MSKRAEFHAAVEAARIADEAWKSCDHAADEACEHRDASYRADAAMEAAREALAASDEPREFTFDDGNANVTFVLPSLAAARAEAQSWGEDGDWHSDGERKTIWFDVRITGEDGSEDHVLVTVDPPVPACLDGHDHDWQSPHTLVGGLNENPSVFGRGGGVIIHEACMICGCRKTTNTWDHRPDTGEQGMTSVSYEPEFFTLESEEAGDEDEIAA